MTGIPRLKVAIAMTQFFGTTYEYHGGHYDEWRVYDNQSRIWRIMNDSSIRALKRENGQYYTADSSYKVEVVSPILVYEDISTVQKIVRQIRRTEAFPSLGSGIHIHIDGVGHTPQTLRNLLNIIASKEDLLYTA